MRHTDKCDYNKRHGIAWPDVDCWCQKRIKEKWQMENP